MKSEAQRVVDEWRAAQNTGDFAAYEKLYAKRFTGVRRTGPRTLQLDRTGWVRDRQRMFAKKMAVRIENLTLVASEATAQVRFVQTWESGSYKDIGPKKMVFVREGGIYKIAREEMLGSAKQPPSTMLRWVARQMMVINDAPDDTVGVGSPTLMLDEPIAAIRAVDEKKLPAELLALRGKTVTVVQRGGKTCQARVGNFVLAALVVPHFGQVQAWKDPGADKKAAGEAAYELGRHSLMANLKSCKDGEWAAAAVPPLIPVRPAKADVRAWVASKVQTLPEWKAIQDSFKTEGHKGRWDAYEPAETKVVEFDARVGGRAVKIVAVSVSAGAGCADFSGSLTALFESGAAGELTLRNSPGNFAFNPGYVGDIDADGNSEILPDERGMLGNFTIHRAVIKVKNGKWDNVETFEVPFNDCPC